MEVIEFTDWTQPNAALNVGDIDLNNFQHRPYLANQVKARGFKLVPLEHLDRGAGRHLFVEVHQGLRHSVRLEGGDPQRSLELGARALSVPAGRPDQAEGGGRA